MMPGLKTLLAASIVVSASCIAAETRSSESGRPRGVGPEFGKFYKDTKQFSCISLPSLNIPISAVNDDYCDCPDGSDEPGTSACSHLSYLSPDSPYNHPPLAEPQNITTPALPGYYCKNKGHNPAYIPFLAVNDGKCDYDFCCDGSDEWQGVGGVKCPDKCKEIGKEWRVKDEAKKKSLSAAVKRRKDLIADATKLRAEIQDRITSLEQEVKDHGAKVKQLEDDVAELEKKEKYKVVKSAGSGSRTTVLAGIAKQRVEELRLLLQQTREQRDAQRARVQELESLLKSFKEEYNPNFNDEGVKRAVRAWEEYAAKDQEGDWQDVHDRELNELLKQDSEDHGINWSEWENEPTEEGDDDVAALYQLRNYLPPSIRIFIAEKISSFREMLVENGVLAPSSPSDTSNVPESPALAAARSNLHTTRSSFTNSERDLNTARDDLNKDFGPNDVFRSLKDVCISTEAGEYEYRHCFLSRLSQIPKKGGGETNMGNYVDMSFQPASDFDASFSPDDLTALNTASPATASSPGHDASSQRLVLNYANGATCWNGPARSTKVVLGCSETEVVWRVRESEKCVYEVWVGTSAMCPENTMWGKKSAEGKKDEL